MGYNARNDEIRDNVTRMRREWEAQRKAEHKQFNLDPKDISELYDGIFVGFPDPHRGHVLCGPSCAQAAAILAGASAAGRLQPWPMAYLMMARWWSSQIKQEHDGMTTEKILAALDKPRKLYSILMVVNPSGSLEELQQKLLKMRDEGLVKFDIHKGHWYLPNWYCPMTTTLSAIGGASLTG
jgi:hypothetical protein